MNWRVLLVSELLPDPQPAGLARHVLGLAAELHRRGCQVDLLGNALHPIERHPDQAGPGRFLAALAGHQRQWKQRPLGCFHAAATALTLRALRRALVAHADGYDVVHYHGHWPGLGAGLPPGLPFMQTRHDHSGDCMLKTRFREHGDALTARCDSLDAADCARCATAAPGALQAAVSAHAVRRLRAGTAQALRQHPVLFVSDHLRQRAAQLGDAGAAGAGVGVGDVLHNAVSRAALEAAAAHPAPRDGAATVQVFGAGTLLPYKGFGALLETVSRHRAPAGWQLTVAGDGPQLAALRERHAGASVRFTGWLDGAEVLRHAAAADAVVVPSLWDEPCASTVLEGLALGRVVYALRRGGTPELAACAGPGAHRLRLFDTLDDLVAALLAHRGGAEPAAAALAHFTGDLSRMADAVLAHYARHFRRRSAS